jgi:hypothetical protein
MIRRTDRGCSPPPNPSPPRGTHHRGPRHRLPGPGRPPDQDPGLRPGRHAHPGPAAGRPRAARAEAGRRHRRGLGPPGSARRDPRRARRAARQPGRGRAVSVLADYPVIADEALRGRRGMYTGANVDDTHLRGVDVERDINVGQWADLREVAAGELCVNCGHRWRRSAASRSATSSSSATSSATPSGSASPARTASRSGRSWAATASASSGRWPRSSRSTTTPRASSGRSRSPRSRSWW